MCTRLFVRYAPEHTAHGCARNDLGKSSENCWNISLLWAYYCSVSTTLRCKCHSSARSISAAHLTVVVHLVNHYSKKNSWSTKWAGSVARRWFLSQVIEERITKFGMNQRFMCSNRTSSRLAKAGENTPNRMFTCDVKEQRAKITNEIWNFAEILDSTRPRRQVFSRKCKIFSTLDSVRGVFCARDGPEILKFRPKIADFRASGGLAGEGRNSRFSPGAARGANSCTFSVKDPVTDRKKRRPQYIFIRIGPKGSILEVVPPRNRWGSPTTPETGPQTPIFARKSRNSRAENSVAPRHKFF